MSDRALPLPASRCSAAQSPAVQPQWRRCGSSPTHQGQGTVRTPGEHADTWARGTRAAPGLGSSVRAAPACAWARAARAACVRVRSDPTSSRRMLACHVITRSGPVNLAGHVGRSCPAARQIVACTCDRRGMQQHSSTAATSPSPRAPLRRSPLPGSRGSTGIGTAGAPWWPQCWKMSVQLADRSWRMGQRQAEWNAKARPGRGPQG